MGVSVASGSVWEQFGIQALGVAATVAWSVGASFIIIKIGKKLIGLRVDLEDEEVGLDLTSHGEQAYDY